MILTLNNNILTIDMPSEIKNVYEHRTILIDDVAVGDALPFEYALTESVFDIKVLLRNSQQSYTENRCYLYDPTLLCKITKYLSNLNKEDRIKSDLASLYYLLIEGTKENTHCSCFCKELKLLYQDVLDLLLLNDCNC